MSNIYEYEFDMLVFIGRFRPLHNGHKHVIDEALKKARHVLVLTGSANRPRTRKNPWTAVEVEEMLWRTYKQEIRDSRIIVQFLDDHMHDHDFHWCMDVHKKVAYVQNKLADDDWPIPRTIGLIGFSKDHTSYYLKKFPQWGSVNVHGYKVQQLGMPGLGVTLNATDLRDSILAGTWNYSRQHVPEPVAEYLDTWIPRNVEFIDGLRDQRDFAAQYKIEHQYAGNKPYRPIMTTTDSVFIQSSHVLLGKRKLNPGKGLWALPGGFAHDDEVLADSSLRESHEETRIKLPRSMLDLSFRFKHVFSDPNRSDDRGRIITHAYLYLLNDNTSLPLVEANDDFEEVKWVPLGLLQAHELYSDHFWIIHKMINLIPCD